MVAKIKVDRTHTLLVGKLDSCEKKKRIHPSIHPWMNAGRNKVRQLWDFIPHLDAGTLCVCDWWIGLTHLIERGRHERSKML
jgi:hypothetical protein